MPASPADKVRLRVEYRLNEIFQISRLLKPLTFAQSGCSWALVGETGGIELFDVHSDSFLQLYSKLAIQSQAGAKSSACEPGF